MQNTNKQVRESWKMSLINKFGLAEVIEHNLIFQPPKPNYHIKNSSDFNGLEFSVELKGHWVSLNKLCNLKHRVSILKEVENNVIVSYVPIIHYSCNSDRVIILSHSNAMDLTLASRWASKICELYEVDVMCYDYSGYGITKQTMKPSELGISRDLSNVVALAQHQYDHIFLWGFSIGSYPTVDVATQFQLSGIILQAPLASLGRIIDNRNSFYSEHDKFSNQAIINKITAPVLIFHGTKDNIIKINHSEQLSKCCQNLFAFIKVEGANHNDIGIAAETQDSEVYKSIRELLHSEKSPPIKRVFELSLKYDNLTILDHIGDQKMYQSNLPTQNKKEINKKCDGQGCQLFCIKF
ncbi:unnamed protein product (macronuclear) [Paramecium tetraurelia]|uniref:Serine hydrolase domain-containing protein n=1 Tax=Paramecium tetraurelia TaxID=5888 RepID=A0DMK3_PARTE|nr:uncharacterized protein GSPATT00018488001 [Paramecium tetraurelia]CAK84270.1 unnamed protein product [Paramecium tetraurelia]|eukprot:XP_001451667.1 hypothetical protein (macronuclear) [Paramecium tetraurelia strain d4-2]